MTDFEKLMYEMREAQRNWFRWHEREDLMKSKALERKVDEWLTRIKEEKTPDLFAEGEK